MKGRRAAARTKEDRDILSNIRDARKLSADGLEDLRRCAVAAVESGVPRTEVARLYGVSRQTVGAWVRAYRLEGSDALRPRRRGRRPGDQLALSSARQLWMLRTMTTTTPDKVGLRDVLWTWQSLAELAHREFGVALATTTIRNYLTRWGFRPAGSQPIRMLPRRAAVAHGLRATTGAMRTGAGTAEAQRSPATETLWTDHARVRWCVCGLPEDPDFGVFLHSDVLFAVTSRGAVLFTPARDPYDGAEIREFYARLLSRRCGPVVIVPGWEPTRRTELLDLWISTHTERTTVAL
ncbi:helix-turn-helix domain-containing protein [Streptomyces sp. NBC_01750]|uniref:helix-turn-helix domain-containing protein n=1 Tax=Streptomyces sp. NBC_01750 TaxID=2975928 RepID=UPI003FA39375